MLFNLYQGELLTQEAKLFCKEVNSSLKSRETEIFSLELNIIGCDEDDSDKWILFVYFYSISESTSKCKSTLFESYRNSKKENYILKREWGLKEFMDSEYYHQHFSQIFSLFEKIENEVETLPRNKNFENDYRIERFCKNIIRDNFKPMKDDQQKEILNLLQDKIIQIGNTYLKVLGDKKLYQKLIKESQDPECCCAKCHYDERPEDFEDDEFADVANECYCDCSITDEDTLNEIVLDRIINIDNFFNSVDNKLLNNISIFSLQYLSEQEIAPFIQKYIYNRIIN